VRDLVVRLTSVEGDDLRGVVVAYDAEVEDGRTVRVINLAGFLGNEGIPTPAFKKKDARKE
jgi:hypothetical protein